MSSPNDERIARHGGSRPARAANLPVVDEATATQEVKQLYQRFRVDFGRDEVPGILQCFATHPPLMEHMMGLAKSMLFVDGALGRQDKEMISTLVSAMNRCAYCTDSHAFSFRSQGGNADALEAVLAGDIDADAIPPRQRALLRFARKVTVDSQSITKDDIGAMRAGGFNDVQIAEAIHVTALFASFNRVVNAFGLPSQEMLKMLEPQREGAAHG